MAEAVAASRESKGVYFPGLNGLRFFAAATVMFAHVGQGLRRADLTTIPKGFMNPMTGKLAVVLFFVLSGFLITHLLLSERKQSGSIALGKFEEV